MWVLRRLDERHSVVRYLKLTPAVAPSLAVMPQAGVAEEVAVVIDSDRRQNFLRHSKHASLLLQSLQPRRLPVLLEWKNLHRDVQASQSRRRPPKAKVDPPRREVPTEPPSLVSANLEEEEDDWDPFPQQCFCLKRISVAISS